MTKEEFDAALIAGINHRFKIVEGVTREDVREHTEWNNAFRFGAVSIDGVDLKVFERHDSTAPIEKATWFEVVAPKTTAFDVTRGMRVLTTPEDRPARGNEPA